MSRTRSLSSKVVSWKAIGVLAVCSLLFIIAPFLWLSYETKREHTVTSTSITYKKQFKLTGSLPYAMSYDSSRVVRFSIDADKGLLALNRLTGYHLAFQPVLGAPGFSTKLLDPETQYVGNHNSWEYIILPQRSGEQQFSFAVKFIILDGVSQEQADVFFDWMSAIQKADIEVQKKIFATDPTHGVIRVISPVSFENVTPIIGFAGECITLILTFLKIAYSKRFGAE